MVTREYVHTPSYLLRRGIVLRWLARQHRGRLLEIGCGRGDLLVHLAKRNWNAIGLEIAADTARVAREAVRPYASKVSILDDPAEITSRYDIVLALEVLEHIADDEGALRLWREWVAPDGRLVLTVPAHMKLWSRSDEFGGHMRRYEREQLRRLVERAGFEIEGFWSFGFPLTAVTIPLRSWVYRRRLVKVESLSRQERVQKSAFDSVRVLPVPWLVAPVVEAITTVFHWLQLPFLHTDLGASYLVVCRKTVRDAAVS
jgi:SAM-dependent methyltransferase